MRRFWGFCWGVYSVGSFKKKKKTIKFQLKKREEPKTCFTKKKMQVDQMSRALAKAHFSHHKLLDSWSATRCFFCPFLFCSVLFCFVLLVRKKMKGVLVLLGLFASVALGMTYNETTATTMVDYCGSAYCCGNLGHGVEHWGCNACALNPGTQNITVFSDLLTQANGFVAYNVPQDRFVIAFLLDICLLVWFHFSSDYIRVIVAFSGTDPLDLQNWIDDLDIAHEKYPYCSKCKVSFPPLFLFFFFFFFFSFFFFLFFFFFFLIPPNLGRQRFL